MAAWVKVAVPKEILAVQVLVKLVLLIQAVGVGVLDIAQIYQVVLAAAASLLFYRLLI
jgi:hypothetical protein